MGKILSICIPTYNRAELLKECLEILLPQILCFESEVDVYVSDNCSNDSTEEVVSAFIFRYPFLKYNKNAKNLGYSGNQVKCFQLAQTKYLAILSDDDLYIPESIEYLLTQIRDKNYSFVAMNYFGFKKKFEKPFKTDYASSDNKMFARAYDILNYPSVGHFSGFIYNMEVFSYYFNEILNNYSLEYYEKHRGIINDLVNKSLSKTKIPSFFIGKRLMAARAPFIVDYDTLNHLCIDYYEYYLQLNKDGIIQSTDLEYRKKLVQDWLPKALITTLYKFNATKRNEYYVILRSLGLIELHNEKKIRIIFSIFEYRIVRLLFSFLHPKIKWIKYHSI